ncbi:unnamed protein product [Mycena citricolor]|uniref:Zn(2)-C6 fungal-type domain-containing protein n=1 Tax=Mycena citricolor TaxID=2018698 RepID=A0AAD2K7J1_9AGAR|nr:unnamed protein product [Mycena citricolor]
MPPSPPASSSTPASDPVNVDHRKRRRNRTTQSCLNCHTTKRMCDRKRPCSRCTQLGLSGNCVYEIDDPEKRVAKSDQETRLTNRIAELEGVIRELKNKPHPRWLSGKSSTTSDVHSIRSYSPGSTSSDGPSFALSPRSEVPEVSAPSHFHRPGMCGCLNNLSCYNAMLELSLGLRQAADVLARSSSHRGNQGCALTVCIAEMDNMLKNSLLNDIPPPTAEQHHPVYFDHSIPDPCNSFVWDESFANEDFMSWLPGGPFGGGR